MDRSDFTLASLTKQSPKEVFEATKYVRTWWTGWHAFNFYDMYINLG